MTPDRAALGPHWQVAAQRVLHYAGIATQAGAIIDGPQVCTAWLLSAKSVPAAALPVLADTLAHALDKREAVRIYRTGRWLGVEIPWPDRRRIPTSHCHAEGLRFDLGVAADGRYVATDQASGPECHVLITGAKGSGKSALLRSVVVLLARANSPEDLAVVMVDRELGHDEGFSTPLARLAHRPRPVATTRAEARAALEWVVATYIDNEGEKPTPLCVVAVDEARWMRRDARTVDALTTIAERGRKHNVRLILAAQRTTADSVARDIVVEFGVRVAGLVYDYRESHGALAERGAERLLGEGDMLVRLPGRPVVRMQAAVSSASDWDALPTRDIPASVLLEGSAAAVGSTDDVDPALIAWVIATGRHRPGTGTVATAKAIRDRTGCGTDRAREIRDLAAAVSTYLPTMPGAVLGGQSVPFGATADTVGR